MNFKDALYEVLDKVMPVESGMENKVSPETIKIVALIWNMLAVSKNVLDDKVIFDNNMTIISIPIEKKTKGNKSASKKTATKNKEAVDGKKETEGSES